jgi:hypothetical protein
MRQIRCLAAARLRAENLIRVQGHAGLLVRSRAQLLDVLVNEIDFFSIAVVGCE